MGKCEVCDRPVDCMAWLRDGPVCGGAMDPEALAECYRLGYERAIAELAIWRDEDAREAKYEAVSRHCTKAEEALAAARRETAEALERAAQIADESREDGRCIAFAIRALASPAAAPAAGMVTCSTDTDEHHGAHWLRIPMRGEESWCLDPIPVAAPPPEPAAPSPDFFADHSDAEVQAALDDVRGKAPAQGAEARIAELEKERDHWRSACIEGMVTGKYPVSPHDDDPQIKSLREAAEASFHGQAYAEMAKRARKAEEALAAARRECEAGKADLATLLGFIRYIICPVCAADHVRIENGIIRGHPPMDRRAAGEGNRCTASRGSLLDVIRDVTARAALAGGGDRG